METSDLELLRRYTKLCSQDAFAEIVQRYVNLVFTAAQRQTSSHDLAQEVVQSVFATLAQKASDIKPGAPLSAWLFLVTRRTALNLSRQERRRITREQTAFELSAMNSPSADWRSVEPLLDEAIASLREADRDAILLRFFENKSLREIGSMIGLSEDAAQKRVGRAVEELRVFFGRQGIAVSAAALATDMSARAVQVAPSGLWAAVAGQIGGSSAMISSGVASSATIAMTALQKTIATFVVIGAVSGIIYHSRTSSTFESRIASLESGTVALNAEVKRLKAERAALIRDLENARGLATTNLRVTGATFPGVEPPTKAAMLHVLLTRWPGLSIPELDLLDESDWQMASVKAQFDTDAHVRMALNSLRLAAKKKLVPRMQDALRAFLAANGGVLPNDTNDLTPYFEPMLPAGILAQYRMLATGPYRDVPNGTSLISLRATVDDEYDNKVSLTLANASFLSSNPMTQMVENAVAAYVNRSRRPEEPFFPRTPDLVIPYLSQQIDPELLKTIFDTVVDTSKF